MPFLHNGRTIYGLRYDFTSGSHLLAYVDDEGRSDRCVKRADGRAIIYTRVGDVLDVNGVRQEVVKVTPIEDPPVLPGAMVRREDISPIPAHARWLRCERQRNPLRR
jgi:hypothetical protein